MKQACKLCGGYFIGEEGELFCPTDRRWNDRQQRREQRAPAPLAGTKGEEGGAAGTQLRPGNAGHDGPKGPAHQAPSSSAGASSRVAAAASQDAEERPGKTPHVVLPDRFWKTRHPSAKRTFWALGPCYCHGQPDALDCEGCVRNGELEWERHHGMVDL
jgi:hypothetical protein